MATNVPCDVSGCPNPARWYYPKPTLFGWNLCDTCKDTDPRGVTCLPLDGHELFTCPEAPKPHAQHVPGGCAQGEVAVTTPSRYFPPQTPLVRTEPAGSSPALRIACPVCGAMPGMLCSKSSERRGFLPPQKIAHKRRREEEVRTR